MTILDRFYFLFKTDAKEAAKDVEDLDKKIAALAERGTKRSEAETKQLNELRKLRQAATQDLRDIDKVASTASGSFMDLATTALGAFAAFATFEGIKDATKQQIGYAASLERTKILTGETGVALSSMDDAFAQTSHKQGEFIDWFTQAAAAVQARGGDVEKIIPKLKAIGTELQKLYEVDPKAAQQRFRQYQDAYSLPDSFFQNLIKGGDAIDALQQKMIAQHHITEQGNADANKFEQAWESVGTTVSGVFQRIGQHITQYGTYIAGFTDQLLQGNLVAAFKAWANPPQPPPQPVWRPKISSFFDTSTPNDDAVNADGTVPAGGIHIDAPNPNNDANDLLSNPAAKSTIDRAIKSKGVPESELTDEQRDQLNAALTIGKKHINAADSASINGGTSGGGSTDNRSLSVGSIVVNTQATSPDGIGQAVSDKLHQEFRATIGNSDDSISR